MIPDMFGDPVRNTYEKTKSQRCGPIGGACLVGGCAQHGRQERHRTMGSECTPLCPQISSIPLRLCAKGGSYEQKEEGDDHKVHDEGAWEASCGNLPRLVTSS